MSIVSYVFNIRKFEVRDKTIQHSLISLKAIEDWMKRFIREQEGKTVLLAGWKQTVIPMMIDDNTLLSHLSKDYLFLEYNSGFYHKHRHIFKLNIVEQKEVPITEQVIPFLDFRDMIRRRAMELAIMNYQD
jgi:hypothetical protein